MSAVAPPWPIAIVTGMLGSGKTTMIGRLLLHAAMADTLVLVNEFGKVGLDHHLFRAVTDGVMLLPNGCLCCTIRDDVLQTLRELHRGWLRGNVPDFGRVLIETTGLAEPAPLITAIAGDPLIEDVFALGAVSTVVDGQYGARQLVDKATCRNQIRVADHLLLSKVDLVDADAIASLTASLRGFNPLATIRASDDVDLEALFSRDVDSSRPSILCDEASDHLAGISTVLLRPRQRLAWGAFKTWLGRLLDAGGSGLLRLKGRLNFDDLPSAVIIQAVHYTFYPVIEARVDDGDGDFLVLIFDGAVPTQVAAMIESFDSTMSQGEIDPGA